MTVEEAGRRVVRRVRKLVQEGKEHEEVIKKYLSSLNQGDYRFSFF